MKKPVKLLDVHGKAWNLMKGRPPKMVSLEPRFVRVADARWVGFESTFTTSCEK